MIKGQRAVFECHFAACIEVQILSEKIQSGYASDLPI